MTNAGAATSIVSAYATNATIQTNATGTINTWAFDNAGNLTLPGNTFAVNYANGTQVPVGVTQDITSNGAMSIMLYDGNIKYNNYATVEPSTGNIAGGNISANGTVTANTAIITTGNITTINSGLLQNGNSNITITSNGNVSIQAAGSTVELVVTSTGANITGTLDATGNITGGNISTSGNVSAGNVIINGQTLIATGTVTATVVANTSPNLSSFSNGTSTSPATTVFTLSIPSAGTWQLEAWIRTFSTTGTPLISGGFYTGGTLVANSETLLWPTPVTNANGAGYMSTTVTTAGAATYTVGLWSTATGIGLYSDSTGRTKAQATQLSSIFALNAIDTMTTTGNVTVGDNLTVTGNIAGGNISATGNISANNFTGNGGGLSNVATKVAGSWTLASGNNTVSISVPLNGTYALWVNGNIPNGIITYTATAVVTNTNVPVLGEQYGWYYAVGNALVLTSIPDQFTGTVGSISNVNTYIGNTANVFTFGITNNSGANAVVNYGYTKL
jgi:hypothetical protein